MSINTNELNTSIEQFGEDMNLTHNWVQGAVGSSVTLGGVSTPSIRSLVAALLNAGGAAVVRQTKAELVAQLNHGENTLGFVTNDATAANNGWYIKVGASGTGSWQQSTYDRTVTQAQLAKFIGGTSLGIITADNKDTKCPSGDINDLPMQRVYCIDSNTGLDNLPEANAGLLVRINRYEATPYANAADLYFVKNYGHFWFRTFAASTGWLTWRKVLAEDKMGNYLHGVELITSSNMQSVCGGDLDNVPSNTIYTVSGDIDLAHVPTTLSGLLLTMSRAEASGSGMPGGSAQIYVANGEFYFRSCSSNGWLSWQRLALNAELEDYVKGGGALIGSSNMQAICGGDLGKLPVNTIYTVNSASGVDGLPVSGLSGLIETVSRGPGRGDGTSYAGAASQRFTTQSAEHSLLFHRTYVGGAWQGWRSSVPVDAMNVLGVGDSICIGHRNGGRGYVGELGLPWQNYGVSGWRLSSTGSGVGPIASQLDTFAADAADSSKDAYGFVPDVIIGEGGINDYHNSVPLGTVPTAPVNPSDTSTLIGGLQLLFWKMRNMYPYAQKLFVIVHKMGTEDGTKYYPTDANSAGYTQEDMVEAMLETCRIYGVKPVDVYHEGQMDTSFDVYLDDYSVNPNSSAWCNIDRYHPLHNGYVNCYVPLIWQALAGGTKKG